MTLEGRMVKLEAQIVASEEKRIALRNQFIALQLVLIRALPVISASSAVRLDAAISDAARYASDHLLAAQYEPEEIREVLDAIETLREDMAGSGDGVTGATCH